jgi:hypothetical protein
MRNPDIQNAELSEAQESVDGDELLEFGDLTETKGGIGIGPDGHNGFLFN